MANKKTVKYGAKCPHCGLSAQGTLTMNVKASVWLDWAWDAHVKACQSKAQPKDESRGEQCRE